MQTGRRQAEGSQVRVGIVGCGAIVEKILARALEYLASIQSLRVVAAYDPDPARRDLMAARFPGCLLVDSFSRLPAEVNLAIVASPVKYYARQTVELLRRRVHVLCEKPMGFDSEECRGVIKAFKAGPRRT